MTTDRDFDRITMAWLADGPEELPDRVLDAVVDEVHLTRQRHGLRLPWRFPTMTMPARVAALVAVGALILATLVAVGGAGGGKPAPSPSQAAVAPAPSPAPTTLETIGIPVLDTAFTSPRNGFSMQVPGIWNLTPATASWQPGTTLQWGDPALDAIQGDDVRFVASAQKLLPEQTPEQWLKAYCLGTAADTGQCDSVPTAWEEIKIAGIDGVHRPRRRARGRRHDRPGRRGVRCGRPADDATRTRSRSTATWTGRSSTRSSRRSSCRPPM